ncbi:MFS transporter [Actinocrispum wychmicini]|uniref:Putative MFS family arabinose efflux permease n=1 Tax=Actinocrispum wychmicini TaxID=1213861 RepID=A0A4R2IND7_9PSEU|nr:MFS transporter [Actinocrispum wychmicini]TCO46623.1 putative MFS family arabinose efflux permease [Actinocrispum wychmicini]
MDLYLTAFARAISTLGNEIALVALMLRLHDHGGWAVAALLAAGTMPMVLLAPLIGTLVDRYDSRTLIVTSSVGQAVTCATLAFASHPATVLALVTVNAIGSAITGPTFGALIRHMSDKVARANSLQQSANTAAVLSGPALGGLLAGVDTQLPLLVDAATFLALALTGLTIKARRRPHPQNHSRDSVSILFTDRPLAASTGLQLLLILVGETVNVAEVFLVRDTFQASATAYGLLSTTFVAGSLLGMLLAAKLDTTSRILRTLPLASVAMTTAIAAAGLSPSLAGVFALFVLAGAAAGVMGVTAATLVILRTPDHLMGRVQAMLNGMTRTAGIASLGLGALLTGLFTPSTVFVLAGTAGLVATAATIPLFKTARAHTETG